MAVSTSHKAALILLAVAAVAGGLAGLSHVLDAEARDRQAVRAFVWDMEKKLRAHNGAALFLGEGASTPEQSQPGPARAHDWLRADVDRVAHLEALQILPGDVDVHAETATADYTVAGRTLPGDPPVPRRGRLVLRRTPEGWRLVANRILEEPEDDAGPAAPTTGSQPRVHQQHTHQRLTARLGSIAVLALLGSAFFLIQPFVTRTTRRRRVQRRRR